MVLFLLAHLLSSHPSDRHSFPFILLRNFFLKFPPEFSHISHDLSLSLVVYVNDNSLLFNFRSLPQLFQSLSMTNWRGLLFLLSWLMMNLFQSGRCTFIDWGAHVWSLWDVSPQILPPFREDWPLTEVIQQKPHNFNAVNDDRKIENNCMNQWAFICIPPPRQKKNCQEGGGLNSLHINWTIPVHSVWKAVCRYLSRLETDCYLSSDCAYGSLRKD